MGFDNITLHTLSVKNASPIRFDIDGVYDPFGAQVRENVSNAMNTLRSNGYEPYYLYRQKMTEGDLENVGFASSGSLGIYNLAMMEDLCDIFACGAGAISKIVPKKKGEKILRFAGFKYPFEYLSCPEKFRENIASMHNLT
jgi:oxygen-independent coproporphyrinogen-3 oxidase